MDATKHHPLLRAGCSVCNRLTALQTHLDCLASVENHGGMCVASATDDSQPLVHRHTGKTPSPGADFKQATLVIPRELDGGVAALLVAKTIALVIVKFENAVIAGVHADLHGLLR